MGEQVPRGVRECDLHRYTVHNLSGPGWRDEPRFEASISSKTFDAPDGGAAASVAGSGICAVGYVIVVVLGLIIAIVMMFVTRLLSKTLGEDNKKTEMFMTANRTVRTGLTASAVVSSWLWSTALLGSSLVGYNFGVAGPFWFAAGCSPMIVFFALLGVSCKRKIPGAHTSLEVVHVRYGRAVHIVFMILCLINNIFACANMLLGASAVISAMTGMHIIAATFLLPVGVSLYTFVGGIKATQILDGLLPYCDYHSLPNGAEYNKDGHGPDQHIYRELNENWIPAEEVDKMYKDVENGYRHGDGEG